MGGNQVRMRNKFGNLLMVIGALLFLAGASLFAYNQHEAEAADRATVNLLPELVAAIEARQNAEEAEATDAAATEPVWAQPEFFEMTEVEIDGYKYVGYVSIPALELELPVMSDWSYPQLKISPCRYTGTTVGDDLVILAHNYKRHFGHISELKEGDSVIFTDMDGVTTYYQVVALDILAPTAVEEMVAGDYDLTLFTCTYGGKSRVTLRCDRVNG